MRSDATELIPKIDIGQDRGHRVLKTSVVECLEMHTCVKLSMGVADALSACSMSNRKAACVLVLVSRDKISGGL